MSEETAADVPPEVVWQPAGSLTLVTPTGHLGPILQRSRDLVAFGLNTAANAVPHDLPFPSLAFNVMPAKSAAMTVEEARAQFRTWILGNGLRECIDAIGPTLEWARRALFLWSGKGTATRNADGGISLTSQITGEDWNREIALGIAKFDRLSLPDKFDRLERQYGFARPDHTDDILSLNAARNCLVHRGGVVGGADVKSSPDGAMHVTWICPELWIVSPTGEKRPLEIPGHVDAGNQVGFGWAPVSRSFALGSRVEFTLEDYVHITTTFLFFGMAVEWSVLAFQEARLARDSVAASGGEGSSPS